MKRVERPPMAVLPESSLVPARNTIAPAPNQFTHEVVAAQGFYYVESDGGAPHDGELAAGTRVVLLRYDGGERAWVADGQGLYVATVYRGLRKLPGGP